MIFNDTGWVIMSAGCIIVIAAELWLMWKDRSKC